MGWTRNKRKALTKSVSANRGKAKGHLHGNRTGNLLSSGGYCKRNVKRRKEKHFGSGVKVKR
jgi:hypothetical protein